MFKLIKLSIKTSLVYNLSPPERDGKEEKEREKMIK